MRALDCQKTVSWVRCYDHCDIELAWVMRAKRMEMFWVKIVKMKNVSFDVVGLKRGSFVGWILLLHPCHFSVIKEPGDYEFAGIKKTQNVFDWE